MSRKAKLPFVSHFVGQKLTAEGNLETVSTASIQPDVDYSSGRIEFKAEGRPTITASVNDKNRLALALRGLMSYVKAAIGPAENLDDVWEFASDRIGNLAEGQYSDRGGERGFNIDRFVTIVVNTPVLAQSLGTTDEVAAKQKIETLFSTLEDREEGAGKKWLAVVRANPGYIETTQRMFPRKPKTRKDAPKVEDLFAIPEAAE